MSGERRADYICRQGDTIFDEIYNSDGSTRTYARNLRIDGWMFAEMVDHVKIERRHAETSITEPYAALPSHVVASAGHYKKEGNEQPARACLSDLGDGMR
jgi:hypothetical protein